MTEPDETRTHVILSSEYSMNRTEKEEKVRMLLQ